MVLHGGWVRDRMRSVERERAAGWHEIRRSEERRVGKECLE